MSAIALTAPSDVPTHMHPGDSRPFGNPSPEEHIVVLGIGNVLWADEGFGVRCVETLQREWTFAPHVELIDGGTQGLYLIQNVQSATRLLIFDAIDYGLAPGTLKLIENDEVPKFMGAKKMSLHQTGFQEVLCLAQFTGNYPAQVLLIGCQPEELEDYGGSLRPIVRQAILSRGYGNCRITNCCVPHTWRVVYYNSQDTVILNSVEVTDMPEVACAAPQDLVDSVDRLHDVLQWVNQA